MSILLTLKTDLTPYAPVPFWSWNNALEEAELLKQIDDMKSVGCGGFVIHARMGLKTEYLSEEWFSLVESCLNAAKERGMSVWIYDENGWPSGFAGGKLLKNKENLVKYLVLEERDRFDETAFAVYVCERGAYRRVLSSEGRKKYYTVLLRRSPSYTDVLDPRVVGEFISSTYEAYYKRFSERFGRELVGFFTDEPQFMRGETPYTASLEGYWRENYGGDFRDGLMALFSDGEEFYEYRVKYYTALNRLYAENYYHAIYDWCEKHGCKLTGHSIQENAFFAQMWGSAGVATTYEYEHVPAIDHLTIGETAKLSARLVGSVAAQTGKKQVLTETFACTGYAATPRDLKTIADMQYVHGVNYMCHHLYAYSLSGQGKYDHPPCFSRQMTWRKQFKKFNLYFTRLGYLLANSEAQVNCTVISPMSSVYLRYDVRNEEPAKEVDKAFDRLQKKLNACAVEYEISDERMLEKYAAVEGNRLRVGKRVYDYVIVPECATLSKSTKALLEQFLAAGGRVYAESRPTYTDGVKDDWSFLKSNLTLEDVAKSAPVCLKTDGKAEFTYRKGEDFAFLYAVNPENSEARFTLPEGFSAIDLVKLSVSAVEREIVLPAGGSGVFVRGCGKPLISYGKPTDVTQSLVFGKATQNFLPVDVVSLSFDGATFGEPEPIARAFERLLFEQYRGKVYVRYRFTAVDTVPAKLRREKGAYLSSDCNGVPLHFKQSSFDINFEEADLSGALRVGVNEYTVCMDFYESPDVHFALFSPEATESLRNCLVYDTELEPIAISGEFCVDAERRLCKFVQPKSAVRIDAQGFKHFAGEMSFHTKFFATSELVRLTLGGNFCGAEIKANGRRVGSCFDGDSVDFFANSGEENYLEIAFSSSLRNALGPFHYKGAENAVGPNMFHFRGSWKNGACADFTPEYRTVPFGISSAVLRFGTRV